MLTDSEASRAYLEVMFDNIDAIVLATVPETAEIIFINEKNKAFFGVTGDGTGRYCYEFLHKRTERCAYCPYNELKIEPEKIVRWEPYDAGIDQTWRMTARLINLPDGRKAHLEFGINITDTRRAQEKLERRDKMLGAINRAAIILLSNKEEAFENAMAEGFGFIADIIKIDRMSVFRSSNKEGGPYITQIYRWDKAEGGTTETDPVLAAGDIHSDVIPRIIKMLMDGETVNGPIRLLPDGEFFKNFECVSILLIPVFNGGQFWGAALFEDRQFERYFTEAEADILRSAGFLLSNAVIRNKEASDLQKALSDAQAASYAKSEFLSRMSHEMRTPMNAIIGMTAIGKRAVTTEQKDYSFKKIDDASKHLLGVINDVLDMSKIEANKLWLSNVEFVFEKVLRNVADVVNFRVDERKQSLHIIIDEAIPASLVGDDQRFAQVVTNLLSNAVKFTPPEGAIYLEAKLLSQAGEDICVEVSVTDNGIGLSEEQRERIFKTFEQAEIGTARQYGGTGLGLSISKRIVEMMGGDIWVESEEGRGAKFTFTAFFKRVDEKGESTANEVDNITADGELTDFAGRCALIAEDMEINREIVSALLAPVNLTIHYAEDGVQAVKMFEESPEKYDLIFMDVQMPKMDGYEATRRIRALEVPRAKTVPIVAMTANVFREDIARCLEAGMNSHVGKPIFLGEVIAALKKYLT